MRGKNAWNHKHLHHIMNGHVKIPRDHKNEFLDDVLYIYLRRQNTTRLQKIQFLQDLSHIIILAC